MNFSSKERDEKSQLGMGCGKDGKHDKKYSDQSKAANFRSKKWPKMINYEKSLGHVCQHRKRGCILQ